MAQAVRLLLVQDGFLSSQKATAQHKMAEWLELIFDDKVDHHRNGENAYHTQSNVTLEHYLCTRGEKRASCYATMLFEFSPRKRRTLTNDAARKDTLAQTAHRQRGSKGSRRMDLFVYCSHNIPPVWHNKVVSSTWSHIQKNDRSMYSASSTGGRFVPHLHVITYKSIFTGKLIVHSCVFTLAFWQLCASTL